MAQPRTLLLSAFAAVYLIWGSTYLAILIAIESMPPLLMAGIRFLAAGAMLWPFARPGPGEAATPTRRDWAWAFLLGFLMFLMGNGFVVLGEQSLPSAVVALLVGAVPLFLVLFESMQKRLAPGPLVVAGLGAGLVGVALLASAKEGWKGDLGLWALLGVMLGSAGWAAGSLLSRRNPTRLPLLRNVALQMVAGGILLTVAALLRGEHRGFDLAAVTERSWLAWLYLVVFGAVVAFTAYAWLLRNVAPAVAGTYAFVNPIVAVVLGALFAREPIGARTAAAAVLVVAAVALITLDKARASRKAKQDAAA
ncbi:MAG: EamA family transporter [Candidatus Thermoplasmatota archaeon]